MDFHKEIKVDENVPEELNMTDLAAFLDVTRPTVGKWTKAGIIPPNCWTKRGRAKFFNVKNALLALEREGKIKLLGDMGRVAPPPAPSNSATVADFKRMREKVKLKTETIKMQQLEGKLLDRRKVFDAQYEFASMLRRNLQLVPQKIIDDVLAAETRKKAERIIADEIESVLEAMSNMEDLYNFD